MHVQYYFLLVNNCNLHQESSRTFLLALIAESPDCAANPKPVPSFCSVYKSKDVKTTCWSLAGKATSKVVYHCLVLLFISYSMAYPTASIIHCWITLRNNHKFLNQKCMIIQKHYSDAYYKSCYLWNVGTFCPKSTLKFFVKNEIKSPTLLDPLSYL